MSTGARAADQSPSKPDGEFVVNVPTETGSCAVIDIAFDEARDTYSVRFSGELLDQSPEAITAAVQMTLLALRGLSTVTSDERRERMGLWLIR